MINSCIVCGSSVKKHILNINDHLVTQDYFSLEECGNCAFRYISNPPPSDDAYRYYDTEEYVEHSDNSEGIVNRLYHIARSLMLGHKYKLLERHSRPRKLLDFGTGTGYFINAMRDRNYEVFGIEISEKARNFGKVNLKLDIFAPSQLSEPDMEKDFGYVTFWHVLEHVYNPASVLKNVRNILLDDGILIIALPNYRCVEAQYYKDYWNGYDVPRHLWHWTKDSFIRFMKDQGFELINTSTLPLDPYYNCLISESYRKRKWFYLAIPFLATYSAVLGMINIDKASSIVYHFKKV